MFGRESSLGEEFACHADFCTLDSGFMATDYELSQSPGTQGQNMRPNIYGQFQRKVYTECLDQQVQKYLWKFDFEFSDFASVRPFRLYII